MRILHTFLFITLFSTCFAQTKKEINTLLNEVAESISDSKEIQRSSASNQIKEYGESAIPFLSDLFHDSTETKVYSQCNNRYLNKGELAIILSDYIEKLPYFTLTKIQNCTFEFCANNPNLIEYYLGAIERNPREFKFRFDLWIKLKDEKNWVKNFENEIEKCRKSKIPCF